MSTGLPLHNEPTRRRDRRTHSPRYRPRSRPAGSAAWTRAAALAGLPALALACSGDAPDPVMPDPPQAFCGAAPTTDLPAPSAARQDVAVALADAADRLVPAMGGTAALAALADDLAELAGHIDANRLEDACILADAAWDVVGEIQVAATAEADRDAVVLALREALALPLPREH